METGQKMTGDREKAGKTGKVWLAGAGPGDAGLLTVKAEKLMERADVIVYDALISVELMSRIPPETEVIYVGKHAGHHPVPQEEINRILVREAKRGKQVLRLKGGDPFVFGRGGEELEALAGAGIPFEVVPGVTSSVAVPAYAGIPVTHRDYTSSFHVITGHARKDGTLRIDFSSLVKLKGTLVFLMSVSSMEQIVNGLLGAGMSPDMPAAVLERGTTARQRSVAATVGTLKTESDRAGIRTPALILVGKVCALSDGLHWAEDRPLGGRQFLLTRPRQNMSALAEQLRDLGAQVIEMPAIRTEVISPNETLREALAGFRQKQQEKWLVFTSPIGVTVFFEQLVKMQMDIRDILTRSGRVKVGAIGRATAAALEKYALMPDVVPDVYSAEALGERIAGTAVPGGHVLVVRAEKGSEDLLPPLVSAGLSVEDVPLYRTGYEMNPVLREEAASLFRNGEIDAVTFTSASTVRGFVRAMEGAAEDAGSAAQTEETAHAGSAAQTEETVHAGGLDYSRICAVCIGEQTARAAAEYGMHIEISREASTDAMTEKILELFGKNCGKERSPEHAGR